MTNGGAGGRFARGAMVRKWAFIYPAPEREKKWEQRNVLRPAFEIEIAFSVALLAQAKSAALGEVWVTEARR